MQTSSAGMEPAALTEAAMIALEHGSDILLMLDATGGVTYANPAAQAHGVASILQAGRRVAEAARAAAAPQEATEAGWCFRAMPATAGGVALLAHRVTPKEIAGPFDTLFDRAAADLLVLRLRHDGAVVVEKANAAFARTTGLVPSQIAGCQIADVVPPLTATTLTEYTRACLVQGDLDCEHMLPFPTGERLVRVNYRAMRFGAHEDGRVLLSLQDLTEARRLEAALRQALRLEVVGQLTGGVAHEFNNLLTTVLGGLDLLARTATEDRQRRWIGMAAEAAQRGATLTQQLLAYARKQFLEPTATDIVHALGGMTVLIRGSLGSRIALAADFPPDTWHAHTDVGQLDAAVMNLIVNARTAMPQGGQLNLSIRNHPAGHPGLPSELDPRDYVVVSVADTGAGMSAEMLSRAMEPFFTTKSIGQGSGLGLSQAYGFARQLGGTLRLTSTLGDGTLAEIFLPRADRPGDGPAQPCLHAGPLRAGPA